MNQDGTRGWSFDLNSDPTADPFNQFRANRRLIGGCAECGRAFERVDVRDEPFLDVMGIRIISTRAEEARKRAAWERDKSAAFLRYHSLVDERGLCPGRGDHTGALLPDFRYCLYPSFAHFSLSTRVFTTEPRRANESLLGSFVPDPSGRYDWRFMVGTSHTQWVFNGDLWPILRGKVRIALQRHNLIEDEMGWFDDPLGRAPRRFFSGVEWTRWESDGTRAWASGSAPGVSIALDEFEAMLDHFLTFDPESN